MRGDLQRSIPVSFFVCQQAGIGFTDASCLLSVAVSLESFFNQLVDVAQSTNRSLVRVPIDANSVKSASEFVCVDELKRE